jgi:hypothetical protein
MPGLITSITKYIGGMLKCFVKDSRSSVVCEEVKKDKGIKKNIVGREIMLEGYKDVLFTGKLQFRRMNMIRSEFSNLYTVTCNKLALSAINDKRVIMKDRISTKAIGHYTTTNKAPMNHHRHYIHIAANDCASTGSRIFTLYILPSILGLYHHPSKCVMLQPNVPRIFGALYNDRILVCLVF